MRTLSLFKGVCLDNPPDGIDGNTGRSPVNAGITVAALGIVFGDIGTSPLYALRECFSESRGIPVVPENVFGAVSLIIWFLIIIVSIKYILFVLRADNKGEGGIMSLMALVNRVGPKQKFAVTILPLLGILGASLLFSDGVITPAISVLSAVEGLRVATPVLGGYVVPLSLIILTGLFMLQSRGTEKIGILFGPVMLLWFLTIAILGIVGIARCPQILMALNPWYAISMLLTSGWKGFALIGAAFLAMTGAEALYADMGHFGKAPIRRGWFFIVFPALVLNYMGQGALLLQTGQSSENLFFLLAPQWFLIPLVIIATAATVIASQAVISGAFSLTKQAVQLGFWPRLKIIHTSTSNIGQVYIPFINGALFTVVVLLVLGFGKSGNLASAYGIAVSLDMLITSILVLVLAETLWNLPRRVTVPLGAFFIALDIVLLSSNLSKVLSGGWVVLVITVCICILMSTWVKGRKILQKKILAEALPVELFAKDILLSNPLRTPKSAIFLSGNQATIPRSLLHNFKHNGVLHAQTLIVAVVNEETPFVAEDARCIVTPVGAGITSVSIHYGFMESPDLAAIFSRLKIEGVPRSPMQLSYFMGKESLIATKSKNMAAWRKQLYFFLSRNALGFSAFYKLPPNRVVELGVQIEL